MAHDGLRCRDVHKRFHLPFQLDGESRKAVVVSTGHAEEWEELSSFLGVVLLQSLLVSDSTFVLSAQEH